MMDQLLASSKPEDAETMCFGAWHS
jgi:hypothetical protein